MHTCSLEAAAVRPCQMDVPLLLTFTGSLQNGSKEPSDANAAEAFGRGAFFSCWVSSLRSAL